jgi:hypothetical protein
MGLNLERIEYRGGLASKGQNFDDLPIKVWAGADISIEIKQAISDEGLLNLGGIHGDKRVGSPIQYDHLKLVLDDNIVEITIFNRAIALFTTDNDKIRRIHRVLCKLEPIKED